MLGSARRAIAAPTGVHEARRRAAVRTEAVPPVPSEQGFRLRERRQVLGRHQGAGGEAAQVRDEEIASASQWLGGIRIDRNRKQRRIAVAAEKYLLPCRPKCAGRA